MSDITGTVLDPRGIPLPGVTMILTGPGAAPIVQITGADGMFNYLTVAAGTYKLTAVHGSFNYAADQPVAHDGVAVSEVKFAINAPPAAQDDRYVKLKYGQYIFLAVIGLFFFGLLIWTALAKLNLDRLDDIEVARGAITYLVAVTTVSMAALLMLAGIMTGGKDLDRRFALGKEILTLLIGILGTIIGFYYGSSIERANRGTGQNQSDTLKVSNVSLQPQTPKAKGTFTVNAQAGGGTAPYTYSVTFTPAVVTNPVTNKQSKDGKIAETFTVSDTVKPGTSVRMIISGKDNKNVPFTTPDEKQYQFVTSQ